MSEETVVEDQEVQQAEKDKAKVAKDLKIMTTNPKIVEFLAGMVNESVLAQLDSAKAEVLANARKVVKEQEAVQTAALASMICPNPKLSYPQLNEYMRCAVLDMRGQSAEPRKELDVDGIITQSLTEAVGSAGGYAVPAEFVAELVKRNATPEKLWPLLNKKPTSKDAVTRWKVSTYVTPNVGAAAKSESATTSDEIAVTEPVFAQTDWTLYPMDARVPIHLNLLDDAEADIVGECVDLVADGFRVFHEQLPLTGTGASRPLGMLRGSMGITSSAVASITTTNVVTFIATLPQRYRTGVKPACLMGSTLYHKTGLVFAEGIQSAQYLMDMLPSFVEAAYMTVGKILIGDFDRALVYYNPLMKMVSQTVAERWTLELAFQERWDMQVPITDAFRIGIVASY